MNKEENNTNFIKEIIDSDLACGKNDGKVHTRFPPEPNGYLHIGHAKSICLNFGIAQYYNSGKCNLRLDDTNPIKEDVEYIDSIIEDVKWLGFDYKDQLFFASDYFQQFYDYAVQLINSENAYVDDQEADIIRKTRGTLKNPGENSPFRNRNIEENLDYVKLLEFSTHLLSKLDRYDLTKIKNDSIFDQKNFIRDAKAGIKDEIINIQKLIEQSEKELEKLLHDVNTLMISWLESGNVNTKLQDFFYSYADNINARSIKKEIILEKMESHMAFVDYYPSTDLVKLHKFRFESRKDVNLKLEILNNSDKKLADMKIRAKIEGRGLDLLAPASGVVRIKHLKPVEISPVTFSFSPISRANTRVILVIQYLDNVGRKCTDWLGDVETNFLGCYVKPLKISENEHENERLNFKDNTSHTSLNIEGLQVNKITKIARDMPGLHLCSIKEEDTRSIIYHAGESSLDGSKYLSMIFLRKLGKDESLQVALELICHSTDIDNSSELKEEILLYIKKKLLELNAKFV